MSQLAGLGALHEEEDDDEGDGSRSTRQSVDNSSYATSVGQSGVWSHCGKLAKPDGDRESLHFVQSLEPDARFTESYGGGTLSSALSIPENEEMTGSENLGILSAGTGTGSLRARPSAGAFTTSMSMKRTSMMGPEEDELSLPPHIEKLLKLRFHSYSDIGMEMSESHFLLLLSDYGLISLALTPEIASQVFNEVASASKALQIGGFSQQSTGIASLGYMGFEQVVTEMAEMMGAPRDQLIEGLLPKSDRDANLLKGSGTSMKLKRIFEHHCTEGTEELDLSEFITMCRESELFNNIFTIADVYLIHNELGIEETKLTMKHFLSALESIIQKGKVTAEDLLEKLVWNNKIFKDGSGQLNMKHEKTFAESNWGLVQGATDIFKSQSSQSLASMRTNLRRRSSFVPPDSGKAGRSASMLGPEMLGTSLLLGGVPGGGGKGMGKGITQSANMTGFGRALSARH